MKHTLTKNMRCEEGVITSVDKNGIDVEIPEENRKEHCSMVSQEDRKHLSRYYIGEKVIAIIYDNCIERSENGVRRRVLKEIVFPDDPDYKELLAELKKN